MSRNDGRHRAPRQRKIATALALATGCSGQYKVDSVAPEHHLRRAAHDYSATCPG